MLPAASRRFAQVPRKVSPASPEKTFRSPPARFRGLHPVYIVADDRNRMQWLKKFATFLTIAKKSLPNFTRTLAKHAH
jgi:hypothetical protein